jgi:molybdopterin converting factor small subunit
MVESAVSTVNIKAYTWIAAALDTPEGDRKKLKLEIPAGATMYDLLKKLAELHPEFREKIFDPETERFNDEVLIITGGKLIQSKDFKSTVLQDKAEIMFSPILIGG